MILAIAGRVEFCSNQKRYYITDNFKECFDKLDILLFPVISDKNIDKVCKICDGLILGGTSYDINPKYYNELPNKDLTYDVDEYYLDKKLIDKFSKLRKPILGICGGMQSINVYFGGALYQDIKNHALNGKTHEIEIKKDTFLYEVYKDDKKQVNSYHHQAIKDVANNFLVSAVSEDGIIEAIEYNNIIGVQWHPEKVEDEKFFYTFKNIFLNKLN